MAGIDVTVLTSLDPGTWTPVEPPIDCDHAVISAVPELETDPDLPALRVRVLDTDAAREFAVWSGSERAFNAAPNHADSRYRFHAGTVAFYVQPVSGTGGHRIFWS